MAKKLVSAVVKRSLITDGRKTSVSIEDQFWEGLKEAAAKLGVSIGELVASIDRKRKNANLSSCLRLYVLEFYRGQI
jgi:predicted DNA-binding ribbon-helix-helix protein